MIQSAFPSYLHKEATKIADFLQQNEPKDFKIIGREVVYLNWETLELPQRVYFGEYNTQSLTLVQEQMLNCLYLCHCNGHLREHYLRELLIVKKDFTLPFIAKLFGDYVIEIVKVLQKIYIVMETNQKRIAILIDADNAQPSTISKIIEEVETYGKILIRWAFGDWTTSQLRGWKDTLPVFSIKPIQSFAHAKEKNSTDITLVINAMNLIHTHPHITTFCIVSSDSDFTELVTELRERDKFVIGIGKHQTPEAFVRVCNVFIFTDDFIYSIEGKKHISVEKKKEIINAPEKGISSLIPLLQNAVKGELQEREKAQLSQVVQRILAKKPSFKPKTYGYTNYINMFKALNAYFETEKVGGNQYFIKIKQ